MRDTFFNREIIYYKLNYHEQKIRQVPCAIGRLFRPYLISSVMYTVI